MQINESTLNDLVSIMLNEVVKVDEIVLGHASYSTTSFYYVIKLDDGNYYKLNFSDHNNFNNDHYEEINNLLYKHYKMDDHDFYLENHDLVTSLEILDNHIYTGVADRYDPFTSVIESYDYYGLMPLDSKYDPSKVNKLLHKDCVAMAFIDDCYIIDKVQLSVNNLILTVTFTDEEHKSTLTKKFVDYMPETAFDKSDIVLIKYLEDDEFMDEHQARRAFYSNECAYSCIDEEEYRDNLYNNLALENENDEIEDAKKKPLEDLIADNETIKTYDNNDYVITNSEDI